MPEEFNIQYVHQHQLDKEKWDRCIDQAGNGLIYAYSFYLDAMCKQWDALVLNDYELVMPLTWNKKWGIKYLYQPFLTAQLGIFGNSISELIAAAFIKKARSAFRFIEISLNVKNQVGLPANTNLRTNFILNLSRPYNYICSGYNDNIKRNIKKAEQIGCGVQKDFDPEKVITLALLQMKAQGNSGGENVARFRKLYHILHEKKMATTYGIYSPGNELLASCVFFFSHNRAYYILVGNSPSGKATGASHALIDAFIKDNAEKNMLLDFEGSDIPGLAQFYKSFGAVSELYPALRINNLPFYLKWMKSEA
jgi:hypothetical protein